MRVSLRLTLREGITSSDAGILRKKLRQIIHNSNNDNDLILYIGENDFKTNAQLASM